MTLMISFGANGGFYCVAGRLCLWWVAFTFDIDDVLAKLLEKR